MDKVGEQLPAVAITAASLTLVFLGLIFASWENFEKTQQSAVRSKFRRRGWLAFFGVVAALLSVTFGFIGLGTGHKCPWPDYVGVVFLAIWGVLILAQAFISLLEF